MPEENKSPSSPQLAIVEHQGVAVALSAKEVASIYKKSRNSGIPFDTLEEVYRRGYASWTPDMKETPTQTAFNRINSFIAEGAAAAMDSDLINEKRGLWDNIHAKRERIKRGSGERMRKPGEKGAPTAAALKASQVKENDDGRIEGSSYPTKAPVGTKFGSFIDKDGRKINKYVDHDLTTRFKPDDEGDWKPESFPTNAPVGTKYGSFTDKDGKKYNKVVGADLVPNFVPTNEESDPCWSGYKQVGMKKKNGRKVPNCVPANEEVLPYMQDNDTASYVTKREDGKFVTTTLNKKTNQAVDRQAHKDENMAKKYLETTAKRKQNTSNPVQTRTPTPVSQPATEKQTKNEEYIGEKFSDEYMRKGREFAKIKRAKMKAAKNPQLKMSQDDSDELVKQYLAKGGKVTKEERYMGAEKRSDDPNNPASRFDGDARVYIATTPGQESAMQYVDRSKLKTIKRIIKECCCDGTVKEDAKGHKSPSGGLTQKGRDYYNRTTGSNLKAPVTTKPSKLKKGSKAANRRKSFCARMGGMKKKMTSAKTARDPDSRINKALRKWNC